MATPWDFPGKKTGVGCFSGGSSDLGIKPESPALEGELYTFPDNKQVFCKFVSEFSVGPACSY